MDLTQKSFPVNFSQKTFCFCKISDDISDDRCWLHPEMTKLYLRQDKAYFQFKMWIILRKNSSLNVRKPSLVRIAHLNYYYVFRCAKFSRRTLHTDKLTQCIALIDGLSNCLICVSDIYKMSQDIYQYVKLLSSLFNVSLLCLAFLCGFFCLTFLCGRRENLFSSKCLLFNPIPAWNLNGKQPKQSIYLKNNKVNSNVVKIYWYW